MYPTDTNNQTIPGAILRRWLIAQNILGPLLSSPDWRGHAGFIKVRENTRKKEMVLLPRLPTSTANIGLDASFSRHA